MKLFVGRVYGRTIFAKGEYATVGTDGKFRKMPDAQRIHIRLDTVMTHSPFSIIFQRSYGSELSEK
jgi:hypothetical protein